MTFAISAEHAQRITDPLLDELDRTPVDSQWPEGLRHRLMHVLAPIEASAMEGAYSGRAEEREAARHIQRGLACARAFLGE